MNLSSREGWSFWVLAVLLTACGSPGESGQPATCFPPRGEWETREPAEVGFDAAALAEAVVWAESHETSMPQDPGAYLQNRFADDPFGELLGPTKERGGVNGMIIRNGYVAAEWGDTRRVDMTLSVTKSYLSTMAGLALARGLLTDLHEPVSNLLPQDERFQSEHNRPITWHHLLRQTSEWEGTLWDKPDVADRRRGRDRTLQMPGSFWEYNDVRVNLTALALLQIWRRPLPEVLKESIMDPIGASDTWRWHGYRNSYVEIDGRQILSVSGGGHWGGGLWISTRDHARFGYLFLRGGKWGDRQLLPPDWVDRIRQYSEIQPVYGYMWWLNTGRQQFSNAPETSFFALGAGSTNLIWIDQSLDLVVVSRWVDGPDVNEFMRLVMEAIRD